MDTSARPHKRLDAWRHSIELVKEIYKITRIFPTTEQYGLVAQMRRAAVSVPSNIAEGMTRRTSKDKCHFLTVAKGSLSELDTQTEISAVLGYIDDQTKEKIIGQGLHIQRLIHGLMRSLS